VSEGLPRKPYPEARPPHLPDVLTRQSPWLLAFAAVAAIQVWVTWTSWSNDNPDPRIGALPALIVPLIPSVTTALLGATLFLRHPDARRTMPLLVFGLALFAVGVLLTALDGPIRTFLQGLTPRPDFGAEPFDTPAETAYRVFTALLGLFAVLYTAAGLFAARRPERGPAERPMLIWLVALATVSSVVSMAGVTQLGVEPSPAVLLQFGIGSLLSLLLSIAWAYLVAVAVGGWLAGDVPHRAWGLAALAVSVLFAGNVLFSFLTTFLSGEAAFTIFTIVSYATLIAWVVLLGAFVLGLPSLETAADVSPDAADPTADRQEATRPGSAAG
jgi:hypothetical protein